MNFKSIGLGAVAATAMVAGSFFANAPAQALTIGGGDNLGLTGAARLEGTKEAIGTTKRINFFSYKSVSNGALMVQGGSTTGAFASLVGQIATVLDLTVTKTGTNVWESGALDNFIKVADVEFDLEKFVLTRTGSSYAADFFGTFVSTNTIDGVGQFTTQSGFTGKNGATISLDVTTAVPTPALLPGLLALGAGVLRKRKSEVAEEVKA